MKPFLLEHGWSFHSLFVGWQSQRRSFLLQDRQAYNNRIMEGFKRYVG
jgi:hypothetical protein